MQTEGEGCDSRGFHVRVGVGDVIGLFGEETVMQVGLG